MNVVSNNCAGSYFMTHGSEKLGNPFSWAIITYSSMDNMLSHFYDIDWAKFALNKSTRWPGTVFVTVDNLVDIHYIHYHHNPVNKTPVVHGHDISSSNIWEYIVEKYTTRLKRMVAAKQEPKFLIVEDGSSGSKDEFVNLYNAQSASRFKICWCAYADTMIDAAPNVIKLTQKSLPKPIVDAHYAKINSILYGIE